MALAVAGLLLLPAAWSLSSTANASLNTTLPQAGPQQGASGRTFGSQAFDGNTPLLAEWLRLHEDPNATWQLVVENSQNASMLIAADNLSVMSIGGFLGTDNTIGVDGFANLVAKGKVRYVMAGGGFGGGGAFGRFGRGFGTPRGGAFGGAPRSNAPGAPNSGGVGRFGVAVTGPQAVMAAVANACTQVNDPTLPAAYQGQIYDCAGRAAALRALGG